MRGVVPSPEVQQRHRRQHRLWVVGSLVLWAGVTFGVAYAARQLNVDFLGWPFSFWVGAQGALGVYVLIIALYARAMNRLDQAWLRAAESAPSPMDGVTAVGSPSQAVDRLS
ncbi:DUF4212 domain-containing protein [Tepidimonas alkaliphilus]|nr:DUF4212 domain-containing protein [Tepidimonas alkaliphilus]